MSETPTTQMPPAPAPVQASLPPATIKPQRNLAGAGKAVYSVALTAFLSLAGGIAGQSWHVPVPFLATWILLLALVLLTEHLSGIIAWAWHGEKIKATPQMVSMAKAAETMTGVYVKKLLASKGVEL